MCATLKDGLQKRGSVYHYRFMIQGKLYKGSTRMSALSDAKAFVERLHRDILLHGQCIKDIPTLRECLEKWADARAGSIKPGYIQRILDAARLHWGPLLDTRINRLDNESVELMRRNYLLGKDNRRKYLPTKTRSISGGNVLVKYLKAIIGWAIDMGYIAQFPFRVKMRRQQEVSRPYIPIDKVSSFLETVEARAPAQINTAIRLMLQLGLRESEARLARWEWYDPTTRTYVPSLTKGGEADPLPLPDSLYNHLEAVRNGKREGFMIPNSLGKPFGLSFTRKWVRIAGEEVGVFGLHPHRLRATYATLHSLQGTDIRTIQSLLRHKDVNTTFKYIGRDAKKIRSAQDGLEAAMNLRPMDDDDPPALIPLRRQPEGEAANL